jgi:hypothetical protein
MTRLSSVEKEALKVAQKCSKCSLCFEDASTFAPLRQPSKTPRSQQTGVVTPLGNCSCIDCPNTFERHRLREAGLEVTALWEALESL